MKHKADAPDARTGITLLLHLLLAVKSFPNQILKNTDLCHAHMTSLSNASLEFQSTFSHLHTALHACSSSVVQTGAVVVVGSINVGFLILASLQPGPGPAQDHLAEGNSQIHTQHYLDVNFNGTNDVILCNFFFPHRKCECVH